MSIRIKLVSVLLVAVSFFKQDAVAADLKRSDYVDNRYTGFILDSQGKCLRIGVDNEFRVSEPCPWFTVPYFVGDTIDDAKSKLIGEIGKSILSASKQPLNKQTLVNIDERTELDGKDIVLRQCYSNKKDQLDEASNNTAIGVLVGRRVPDLKGKTEAEADQLLVDGHFSKTVTYLENKGRPGGIIQDCADCGKVLPQYSNVAITVTKTVIPDLTKKTLAEAQAILNAEKLDKVFTLTDDGKDKPDDVKIEFQFPRPGEQLPVTKEGQKIYLVFPSRPPKVSLPDVTGDFHSAIEKLKKGGFPVAFGNLPMFEKWTVKAQDPVPGLVNAGSAVTLTVFPWICTPSVTVPSLRTSNFSSARQTLESGQLKIQQIASGKSVAEDDEVVGQFPVANEKVCPGTTVYAVTQVPGEPIYYFDIAVYLELTKLVLIQAGTPPCKACTFTEVEKIVYVPVHDYMIFFVTLIGSGLLGAAGMAMLPRRLRSRPLSDEGEDIALVSLLMLNKNPKFHVRPVLDWGVQTIGPNNHYE
ncbi:PASTA domain-containing protein [Undibacterium pigrum]|uniref:PASTA domain-containing protein n=1 Tax=Undibacterium pigrum TaxID=401470 RepID=A0A318IQI9_9BURK|nr:PASTA domain-containing protein [Undibacterium pigrum]PXX34904.1 PASTA domain-containing protein [Undibacterium pigrum]